jgi:hypothetical protein
MDLVNSSKDSFNTQKARNFTYMLMHLLQDICMLRNPSIFAISFQKVTIFRRVVCAASTKLSNRRNMVHH